MPSRDPSKGIIKTGILSLNQGAHQYRMRVENGLLIIDHFDRKNQIFKNDFVVYPTDEVGDGTAGTPPAAAPPTMIPSGAITSPPGASLVLAPSNGNVYVDGTLELQDKVLTLNAVAKPTDLNADQGGVVLRASGSLVDPQGVSLLWNKNGDRPYWSFMGGDLGFGKRVGSKVVRYRFVIDDATEQLQLWKYINEDHPRVVMLFNEGDTPP